MLTVDKVYGQHTSLAKSLSAMDTTMAISMGTGSKFRLGDGGHYYVTIKHGAVREVVKVVGRIGDTFTVERGQDNTSPINFPYGSCVYVEWNPQQLCEYIKQCAVGDSAKIAAQDICFTCDTCIKIDDGGHITAVNGGDGC